MFDQLEAIARQLEHSPDYRVLRRLRPQMEYAAGDGAKQSVGLVLDVETTGLATDAEVIELGMIKFSYSAAGEVLQVIDAFNALQQPKAPIPAAVSRITGISDAMVEGHAIDSAAVAAFVADARLIIAHNSAFDRPHCEKNWPIFADRPWACSLVEIAWRDHDFKSGRLDWTISSPDLACFMTATERRRIAPPCCIFSRRRSARRGGQPWPRCSIGRENPPSKSGRKAPPLRRRTPSRSGAIDGLSMAVKIRA